MSDYETQYILVPEDVKPRTYLYGSDGVKAGQLINLKRSKTLVAAHVAKYDADIIIHRVNAYRKLLKRIQELEKENAKLRRTHHAPKNK